MQQKRFREDMQFVKQQIDVVLRAGTEAGQQTVVQIADMEYVRVLAQGDNELEILELLVRIFKFEKQQNVERTFLDNESSLSSLLDKYYKVLFYLQRIWFELEECEKRELIVYVEKERITPYAVYMILENSRIADKERVWQEVVQLWGQQYE